MGRDLSRLPATSLQKLLALNDAIKTWLNEIEERGYRIALAVREVYDQELWHATHLSFGAWFEETFRKHRSRASQLIAWARLPTIVNNESQARVIANESPEVQAELLEEAGGPANATAAKLKAALEKRHVQKAREEESAAAAKAPQSRPAGNKAIHRIVKILNKALALCDRHGEIAAVAKIKPAIREALEASKII
jgi:hypothetical protein